MKNQTSQTQFKRGYVPQEPVQPHSMDNRQAGPPTQRRRDSVQLGAQTEARPGLSGLLGRSKLSNAPSQRLGKPRPANRGR